MLYDADSIPSLKDALSLIYARTGYQYEQPMALPFQTEKRDSSLKKTKKKYSLGDAVRFKVMGADVERKTLDYKLV